MTAGMEMATERCVTAVVAAYNEAERIGSVLDVLTSYEGFAEVIVVDDGSTDGTANVAAAHPVTVLTLELNGGKGQAMDLGVSHADTDVIFFADADIVGLTHHMIQETVRPVVEERCEMFVLMRNRRIYLLRTVLSFLPLLGGERALTADLWQRLPDRYKDRFRIEAGLNFYAIHHGRGLQYRVFPGITQTVKEAKFGLVDGMRRRMRMSADVIAASWDLQRNDLPGTTAARRRAAVQVALSMAGMLLGLLVLAAGVAGPVSFVTSLFSSELAADPQAPFVTFLLSVLGAAGATAVLAVGGVLTVLNLGFFFRGLLGMLTADRVRLQG